MVPKIEVSDAVIEQLVKDHLHRESEIHSVTKHAKKHGLVYIKFTIAIGALVIAINGYTDLQERNVSLAKENRVLFNAVAKKVNGMAEELAYMRGRVDGMKHKEAANAVKEKIKSIVPIPVAEPPVGIRRPRGTRKFGPMSQPSMGIMAHVAIEENQILLAPALQVNAYDALPEDLADLLVLEDQAQEQLQEELSGH